jgi:hypothetical protein
VACPHFRKIDNECGLLDNIPDQPDDDAGEPEPDRILRKYCLGTKGEWRQCPIFRRRTVESKVGF